LCKEPRYNLQGSSTIPCACTCTRSTKIMPHRKSIDDDLNAMCCDQGIRFQPWAQRPRIPEHPHSNVMSLYPGVSLPSEFNPQLIPWNAKLLGPLVIHYAEVHRVVGHLVQPQEPPAYNTLRWCKYSWCKRKLLQKTTRRKQAKTEKQPLPAFPSA